MEENRFDYNASMARLEEITARVEDPDTSLDDIGALVEESAKLMEKCRAYLRTVRESVEGQEK